MSKERGQTLDLTAFTTIHEDATIYDNDAIFDSTLGVIESMFYPCFTGRLYTQIKGGGMIKKQFF